MPEPENNHEQLELPAAYDLIVVDAVSDLRQHTIDLALNRYDEGTIIWCKQQHAARARFGREWICNKGDLYSALILRPEFDLEDYGQIAIVAGLALGNAIAASLSPMTALAFQWPNKITIANHRIAGVWLDSGTDDVGEAYLVVSVSVNIKASPEDFSIPAMSIAEAEGGTELDAQNLFTEFAREFITQINLWSERGFPHIWQQWVRRAEGIDSEIDVNLAETIQSLNLVSFENDGGIVVSSDGDNNHLKLNTQMEII